MEDESGEGKRVDSSPTACKAVSLESGGASPSLPTSSVVIGHDDIILRYRGEEFFEEASALAWLLAKDQLFVHGTATGAFFKTTDEDKSLIGISVNCNDMFAWACADAEELPFGQLRPLYEIVKADEKWGSAKWCCLQRNQRPQPPVERDMRKDGSWDETMEALPLNTMDKEVEEACEQMKNMTARFFNKGESK